MTFDLMPQMTKIVDPYVGYDAEILTRLCHKFKMRKTLQNYMASWKSTVTNNNSVTPRGIKVNTSVPGRYFTLIYRFHFYNFRRCFVVGTLSLGVAA